MTGIPVHTSSPINANVAAKASAISPSTTTAASQNASSTTPATTTATTTATATGPNQSQSAKPGSVPALPQPTSGISYPSNAFPVPTRTINDDATANNTNPPPPQPGALPNPYSSQPQPSSNPAQPQPSNPAQPRAPLPEHQENPNLTSSDPFRAQPIGSTTSTTGSTFTSHIDPNQQHHHPTDLSHPPGYIQNSPLNNNRIATDDYRQGFSPGSKSSGRGQGILDGSPSMYMSNSSTGESKGIAESEEKSVWDTAKEWAYAAGKKLSEGEEQVWRSINREK